MTMLLLLFNVSLLSQQILVPHNLGATTPSADVDSVRALGLEFFLGFILVLVVCGVCDPNKPFIKLNAALAIGLTVTVGHLTTVSIKNNVVASHRCTIHAYNGSTYLL
jgi:glycerol uptake facilitator-like aquaporin